MICFSCKKKLDISEKVGRRDECEHCGVDLHVCFNCQHYDRSAYNECRETQAERVLEKDRSNFCDYFSLSSHGVGQFSPTNSADDAKKKLEELFRKK